MWIITKPIEWCFYLASICNDLTATLCFKADTTKIIAYSKRLTDDEQIELEQLLKDLK